MKVGASMFLAYQFKVELLHVEPTVNRTFIIPADTTFKRLHDTLQFVMGWQDYHLYEFFEKQGDYTTRFVCSEDIFEEEESRFLYLIKKKRNGEEMNKWDERAFERLSQQRVRKAWTTKLPSYFKNAKTIQYQYDFGDNWEHVLTLEKVIEDYAYGHPMILLAEGACPPEDVGGPGGYAYFLEAWNDASHEEHESMRQWGEGHFGEHFDLYQINKYMEEILKLKKIKK